MVIGKVNPAKPRWPRFNAEPCAVNAMLGGRVMPASWLLGWTMLEYLSSPASVFIQAVRDGVHVLIRHFVLATKYMCEQGQAAVYD